MQTLKLNHFGRRNQHQGVVLIVALLLLMVLSILASISIRGASSTEQVANQERQKTLAQQAAETALRFCEEQVQLHELDVANGVATPGGFTPQAAPVGAGVAYTWENMSNWDATTIATNPFVGTGNLKTVAFTAAGDGGASTYFLRQPECMSQYTTLANTKVFVTTARGFGPEVGAKVDGVAPQGTEVWLQSVITMK